MTNIIGFGVFFVFGYFFLTALWKKLSFAERLGGGFLFFSGVFTFAFFVIHLYGKFPLTLATGWGIIGTGGIISMLALFLSKGWLKVKEDIQKVFIELKKISWWQWLLLGVVGFSWFVGLLYGILFPISGWDSLVLYDFYGYVFAKEGNVLSTLRYGYFDAYPFYIHLMHMWAYLQGAFSPLFVHALLFISFCLVIWGWARRWMNRPLSWVVLGVVTGIGSLYGHVFSGYNNLNATIFLSLSFLYTFEWLRTKDWSFLFLSAIMGGFSLWCRNGEPWWLSLLLVYFLFGLFMFSEKLWKKIILIGITIPLLMTTKVVWETSLRNWNRLLGGEIVILDEKTSHPSSKPAPIPTFLDQFKKTFVGIITPLRYFTFTRLKTYLPLTIDMVWRSIFEPRLVYWYIFLLLCVLFTLSPHWWKNEVLWVFPLFLFANMGLIFAGTYIFIQTFKDWNIPGSAYRMSLFLEVLIVLWGIVLGNEMINEWIKNKKTKEIF